MSESNNIVSIIIAIVALIGSIASASVTAYVNLYSARRTTLEKARNIHFKYHNPILHASHHLQVRFHNITDRGLLGYRELHDDYVVRHTIYLVGQYFAWHTILDREIQFLVFDRSADTVAFRDRVSTVRTAFDSDDAKYGRRDCMIWAGLQMAIGEIMMRKEEGGQLTCMTYVEFCSKWDTDEEFKKWVRVIKGLIDGDLVRMRHVQHALVDLVELLDPNRERYAETTLARCTIRGGQNSQGGTGMTMRRG
ncbi:hypothetical protein B0H13DRAFT_2339329 [Mycena leptocephala]|nr:hypothetical protein B0H13DRAFT_2339329 [Mycena leptocephala]